MSRITPPIGYDSWNIYIEDQADASLDQSGDARRLVKRDIKLGMIAHYERYADGDTTSPSYRLYNVYESPGTVSPDEGHPWLTHSSAPTIITDGLQVHLQTQQSDTFNSSTWPDTSGNGYDAILHNISSYQGAVGQLAGAITDGAISGSYIEIPYNLPAGDSGWTVSIQAALDPSIYWAVIFGNESWNAQQGFLAYLLSTSTGRITRGGISGTSHTIPTVGPYTTQIFDFVKQPFGGQFEVWVDGSQIYTVGDSAPSWGAATNNIFLGARHNNNGIGPKDYCPGVWWNARVYDRALNSDEIQHNLSVIQAGYS